MRKKRLLWVGLGAIALVTVWFAFLRPPDEPKYQGRSVSEWLVEYFAALNVAVSSQTNSIPDQRRQQAMAEAEHALRAIGTNALPCYIKWIQSEPWAWQQYLRVRLPSWLEKHQVVRDALGDAAKRRAAHGWWGIQKLGTKATSAIPVLEVMMKTPDKSGHGNQAIILLGGLGEKAIPVLQRAFADPRQLDRPQVVWALSSIAARGNTDACLPILVAALNDNDASVRSAATNVLRQVVPNLLTNAPAK